MLVTDAKLYLPISETTLTELLETPSALGKIVTALSVPELSALFVLQTLHRLPLDNVPLLAERALARTHQICKERVDTQGHPAFIAEVIGTLDVERIGQGLALLELHGIYCLDKDDVARKDYLDAEGQWDFAFRDRHLARLAEQGSRFRLAGGLTSHLTEQQARIFEVARADLDDHLHVQGYAGTGKSHLIRVLLDLLRNTEGRVLVLAERWPQLQALMAGIADRSAITAKTFGGLASTIVPNDLTSPMHMRMRRSTQSYRQVEDSVYVELFDVKSCESFSAVDIVRAAHATVTSFCNSNDPEIELKHIPKNYSIREDLVRAVVVAHAREFWLGLLNPPRSFDPPIRSYHQVKYAALNGWRVPAFYTHVVIDECHNLSKAMMQILGSGPQAIFSLGDEYQRLHGLAQHRSDHVRQREITCSVRSGRALEQILNPIIDVHPARTKDHFVGNRWSRTSVTYYQRAAVPAESATILVADRWELFEWAQRLAEKVDFKLLSNHKELSRFVHDCIELYRNGIRGRQGELFRFGSWDELANRRRDDGAFRRIDSMLAKGYGHEDWRKTAARFENANTATYALGRIEDVRNQECDSVMLTPELLRGLDVDTNTAVAEIGSAVYVAVTRARRRLIVPEALQHWIEEISGHGSSRLAG